MNQTFKYRTPPTSQLHAVFLSQNEKYIDPRLSRCQITGKSCILSFFKAEVVNFFPQHLRRCKLNPSLLVRQNFKPPHKPLRAPTRGWGGACDYCLACGFILYVNVCLNVCVLNFTYTCVCVCCVTVFLCVFQ